MGDDCLSFGHWERLNNTLLDFSGQAFGDGNGCFLSLWPVGHREGLGNILLEFFCQTIGKGYGCFVSLWPK